MNELYRPVQRIHRLTMAYEISDFGILTNR